MSYQPGKRWGVRRPRQHNGYVEDWCLTRQRYVYQHRLVMEAHVGRLLDSTEVVHHVNGDKQDNRIENLSLHASHSEHVAEHVAAGTWAGKGKPRPHRRTPLEPCPMCGQPFKPWTRRGQRTVTCSVACSNRYRVCR